MCGHLLYISLLTWWNKVSELECEICAKAIKMTISWTWYLLSCKSLLYHRDIHLEIKLYSHPEDEVFLTCLLCWAVKMLTQLSLSWLMFKLYYLFSLHIFTIDNKIYFVIYYTPPPQHMFRGSSLQSICQSHFLFLFIHCNSFWSLHYTLYISLWEWILCHWLYHLNAFVSMYFDRFVTS